jgi:hypothetical protein
MERSGESFAQTCAKTDRFSSKNERHFREAAHRQEPTKDLSTGVFSCRII